jgi:hypothetical protein
MNMKLTLTVACNSLKSAWQAVFLRSALTALLLALLAALHATRNSPEVPRLGILHAGSFQALETSGSLASDDWN